MDALIKQLDDIFVKKAPFQLPEEAKEWIVKYGPWITLVVIGLFLPFILFALTAGAIALPFAALVAPGAATGLSLALIFLILSVGLDLAALPGLFARKKQGWNLVLYGTLMFAVFSLVSFQWLNLIFGTLVSLYFLMQIRSKYN